MNNMHFRVILLGFSLTVWVYMMFVHSNNVWSSHHPDYAWMGSCCGLYDCLQVPVAVISDVNDKGFVQVYTEGVVLEVMVKKVKESQDGHTYVCLYNVQRGVMQGNIRCIFHTTGV